MSVTFHLLRHGETPSNSLAIVQGQSINTGLSPLGKKQTETVGKTVFNAGGVENFWRVYCSVMVRTRETLDGMLHGRFGEGEDNDVHVQAIRQRTKYDVRIVERAHGAREGLINTIKKEEADAIEAELMAKDAALEKKKVEDEDDVAVRLKTFIEDVMMEAGNEKEGLVEENRNVLIVTHGGVIRVLLRDIFDVAQGSPKIKVFNSSLSLVEVPMDGGKARLVGPIGDTSHIPEEVLTRRTDQ